jgi:hypothetical protein
VFEIDDILANNSTNYFLWVIEAIIVFAIIMLVSLLVNVAAYRKEFTNIVRFVTRRKAQ